MLLNYRAADRYLVTGGCGFIGSHLVDALIARGHSVVVLDDLSTGKKENLHLHADLIVGDARDPKIVEYAFEDIDGCFHLAAIASVEKSTLDWARTHTVNVTAAVNIFQAASRMKKKVPVVYTSSAAVYGNCRANRISEETGAHPLTAYGVDKLGCDLHAKIAWEIHGVPTLGLRPFNVYGTRQDPSSPYSGVISIFANRLQHGLPITIYGDGEQKRDFVYVADAVKTFITAMEKLKEKQINNDIINICTGRGTSINSLAEMIAFLYGRRLQCDHAAERKGDIRYSIGDPSKLLSHLGLALDTTVHAGLIAMMKEGRRKPELAVSVA